MGKYEDLSIKKLVEGINESYYLPEIQREFVWNSDKSKFEDKVYDLFDSLMRGYPIGTMLFWEVKHEDLERDNRIMKRGLILMIRFENKNVLGKNQDYFKYVIKEAIKSRVIFLSSNIKGHKRLNKFLNK